MTPVWKKFDDLHIGDTAEFPFVVTEEIVRAFASFSGDNNPLHVDFAYAQSTDFKKPIAHGMIAGALFSRLIGMYLPGAYATYLSQTIQFRKPIFFNTDVLVRGSLVGKSEAARTVTIKTEVLDSNGEGSFVTGEALVYLLA